MAGVYSRHACACSTANRYCDGVIDVFIGNFTPSYKMIPDRRRVSLHFVMGFLSISSPFHIYHDLEGYLTAPLQSSIFTHPHPLTSMGFLPRRGNRMKPGGLSPRRTANTRLFRPEGAAALTPGVPSGRKPGTPLFLGIKIPGFMLSPVS